MASESREPECLEIIRVLPISRRSSTSPEEWLALRRRIDLSLLTQSFGVRKSDGSRLANPVAHRSGGLTLPVRPGVSNGSAHSSPATRFPCADAWAAATAPVGWIPRREAARAAVIRSIAAKLAGQSFEVAASATADVRVVGAARWDQREPAQLPPDAEGDSARLFRAGRHT
jgi:hypothetical protein